MKMMDKQNCLSHQRLREVISYDPLTGSFVWKQATAKWIQNGAPAGSVSRGYLTIRIDGLLWPAHRLAWFYVHGEWPKNDIDHRDLNRGNNAISNLREATRSQNLSNANKRSANTSGFKGVSFMKSKGKWRARIKIDRKEHHLGLFDDPKVAHVVYSEAAKRFYGEFARTE